MAIADDVSIDTINKVVRRAASPSTTVYSVNALYSYLMDYFDELTLMDDTIPMSAQTPTSYTMTNGWYIQEALTQFLDGGAIQTSGYLDDVRTLICGSPSWVNFAAGDLGLTLTGGTTSDTGSILDYDNTAYKIWVRMDAAGDTFDDAAEAYTCGGTGSALSTAISTTGEAIYANPYTLGALEGTPAIYIYQNALPITSWWVDGHFDILIKVAESGVDIDSKAVTVTTRTWTDTYSTFEITLTTAGQNAVPLGTQDDLNNTLSEAAADDLTDGTTATIAIDFSFTSPFTYDIGDGAGAQDYEVQIDCDGQTLDNVYEVCKYWTRDGSVKQLETGADAATVNGEAYRYANSSYAEVTASPLGTFAGGKFFGARSVYFTNLDSGDAQNFQLIDKAGTTRNPPDYQSFIVNGLASGDRVAVYLESGGDVDKSQYTLNGANPLNTITVTGSIPNDTPPTGTIFVVDDDGSEIGYAFSAWSGSDFTVVVGAGIYAGTETAYVPYIYIESSGTSVQETNTIYVTPRAVICRVRIAGIIPFETTGTYGTGGYTATAIRTTDSIYTP